MADGYDLGATDFLRYTELARQLIAVCGYFYTMGHVPNGPAFSEGRYYRLVKHANEAQCCRDVWKVAIIGGMLGNIFGTYGVRGVDYAFDRFMQDAVGPVISGKPTFVPPEWQTEVVLEPQDKSNAPFIETEGQRHMHWLELRERLNGIIPNVARPVGRSAERLTIAVDGRAIGVIDTQVLHRLLQPQISFQQAQITEALKTLQSQRLGST